MKIDSTVVQPQNIISILDKNNLKICLEQLKYYL